MSHSTFLPSTFNGTSTLEAPSRPASARQASAPRWPWIAIAGCVLMFAVLALNHLGQGRIDRASEALHSTWMPAVDKLADIQAQVKDLSGEATRRSAWTPGQLRGRISDDIGRFASWMALPHAGMDASTPELLRVLQQRWDDYLAMPDVDTPARAARLRDAAAALERLSAHCLAQGLAQADIAAGR